MLKIFGLFRFVSVFRTRFETTETNKSVSKQIKKNENKILEQKCFVIKLYWKKLSEKKQEKVCSS
jgi:hypothetical protein